VKNLHIEATESTPTIRFDWENNILEIKGVSYPENTTEFYGPVFFWLEEYFSQLDNKEVTANIEIVYFNSNSWKVLMGFFELLNKAASERVDVTANWIYDGDDDDILEYGEEFQEEYRGITFNFVQKIR
jgi:hypothetical protein